LSETLSILLSYTYDHLLCTLVPYNLELTPGQGDPIFEKMAPVKSS